MPTPEDDLRIPPKPSEQAAATPRPIAAAIGAEASPDWDAAEVERLGALCALRDLLHRARDFDGVMPGDLAQLLHCIATHRPSPG